MNRRGITLIELMVVVAIVGILAALGSIAYTRYVTSSKIKRLEQYALEVQSGQERYRSRNNTYWEGGVTQEAQPDKYKNLLDFSNKVPADVEILTIGWDGTGSATCDWCPGFDADVAGYGVRVRQDFDGDDGEMTTIRLSNTTPSPILTNEGE